MDRAMLRVVVRTVMERNLSLMAAGFAYFAFVAIIPLVGLVIVLGAVVGGELLAHWLIRAAGDMLPPVGVELLEAVLTTEAGRAEATLVGLVVGGWAGLRVVRGLSMAFDVIYGAAGQTTLREQVLETVTVAGAIVGALALMIVTGVVVGFVARGLPFAWAASWLAMVFGLVLVMLPLYYVLPPIPVRVTEALPGALVAAVGLAVLQVGFQAYTMFAAQYHAYGLLGGILLFATWLYFAGLLILFCAVLNVVRSRPDRLHTRPADTTLPDPH